MIYENLVKASKAVSGTLEEFLKVHKDNVKSIEVVGHDVFPGNVIGSSIGWRAITQEGSNFGDVAVYNS